MESHRCFLRSKLTIIKTAPRQHSCAEQRLVHLRQPLLLISEDKADNLIHQIKKEFFEGKDGHSIEILRSLIQVLIHKLFRIKSKGSENFTNQKYHLKFRSLQELIEKECFESNGWWKGSVVQW